MSDLTIVTPFRNGLYPISLMYESYVLHHGKPDHWICCYDESWDGATEYAQQHATVMLANETRLQAGQSMDKACNAVQTEYLLLVETDVEFLGPAAFLMLDLIKKHDAFCVSNVMPNPGEFMWGDKLMISQPRLAHHCSLFNVRQLTHLLKFFSFESYCNFLKREYYDGGAMILRAAQALNSDIIDPGEINDHVCHYGGVTSIYTENIDPNARNVFEYRHEIIKKRLDQLRSGSQTRDWLIRTPTHWMA